MIQVSRSIEISEKLHVFVVDDEDNVSLKRKPSKKRARYETDDDFDATDAKKGDGDFVPGRRRYVFVNLFEIFLIEQIF